MTKRSWLQVCKKLITLCYLQTIFKLLNRSFSFYFPQIGRPPLTKPPPVTTEESCLTSNKWISVVFPLNRQSPRSLAVEIQSFTYPDYCKAYTSLALFSAAPNFYRTQLKAESLLTWHHRLLKLSLCSRWAF